MKRLTFIIAISSILSLSTSAQNWPQFRGPGASGVVEGPAAAHTWNAEKAENLVWKTKVPGLAHSSPVIWGNIVFVTTAVTSATKDETRFGLYGDVAPVKNDPKHTWKVYALDKRTGKILWERVASEGLPKVKRHPKSTHADSTPATDGKHLVVLFGSEGLYAYDFKGKLLWKQDVGVLDAGWFYDPDYQWEHGLADYLPESRDHSGRHSERFIRCCLQPQERQAGLENSARRNSGLGDADGFRG